MKAKLLSLSCLLPLFFLAACGGDGGTSLQGRVLDEGGRPVQGAQVVLVSRAFRDEVKSREDGSFRVSVMHDPGPPFGTLTVSKEGYETYSLRFESGEELGNGREIVLKRPATAAGNQK
jgi:hypothetical protein